MIQLWRAFGELVPLFLFIVLMVSVIVFFLIKKMKLNFITVIINTLFLLSIMAILLVTLYPKLYGVPVPRLLNLIPFIEMYNTMFYSVDFSVPIRNLALNILLFVPFGFFFSLSYSLFRKVSFRSIIVGGLLLSFVIELVQYSFPTGRIADIDDLLLNTLGTLFGYLMWRTFNSRFSKKSLMQQSGAIAA